MTEWAKWKPVIEQGQIVYCIVEHADYVVYGDWAKVRGQLTFQTSGLPLHRVEIHGLPESLKDWAGFGQGKFLCPDLIYVQDLWTDNDILLVGHFDLRQQGGFPLMVKPRSYFGENPKVTLKLDDVMRFEVNFAKRDSREVHPAIPLNLQNSTKVI